MIRKVAFFLILISIFTPFFARGEGNYDFSSVASGSSVHKELRITTNVLPWAITIPNIGAEYVIGDKWSAELDVWFCPWKLSDRFSVKTVAILPEGRWWLKTNRKGFFFDVHLNIAWYNVRANTYRYQDKGGPLFGGGIGAGYRIELKKGWGLEFELGAGASRMKYDRFYNIPNGALKDTRVSTYWGIDRLGVSVTYNLWNI